MVHTNIGNHHRIENLYNVLGSYMTEPWHETTIKHFINRNETNEKEIILELTAAIYNGLYFGNWPWSVKK